MPGNLRATVKADLGGFGRVGKAVERGTMRGLEETGALVVNHARGGHPKVHDDIQGKAANRYRVRTGPGTGEFVGGLRFLTRTAVLRNSYKATRAQKISNGYVVRVFTAVRYGQDIEFGTASHAAFPTLRPALEANRRIAVVRVSNGVTQELKKL